MVCNVWGQAMRAALIATVITLAQLIALGPSPARADEEQVSEYLARVQGIALLLEVTGKAPCDFARDRMMTSAKFVLNSASVPFDPDPQTDEGEDRSRWAMVVIEAHALSSKAGGCVWTLATKLYGQLEGGEIFGLPSGHRSIQLWIGTGYGTSDGNGLTSFVMELQDSHLKTLMNDLFESRKRYPS